MVVFHQENPPPKPNNSKRSCKFFSTTFKDVFPNCCSGRILNSSPNDECPMSDEENDQEEIVVSEIKTRAMEKLKRKPLMITNNFSYVISSKTGQLFVTQKTPLPLQQKGRAKFFEDEEDKDEFFSVGTCLTHCTNSPTALTKEETEAFLTARTEFSRCSSFNVDGANWVGFSGLIILNGGGGGEEDEVWKEFKRRLIIKELCHCQGWPFGLCRKLVLLPPLPKSPTESWSWRKSTTNAIAKFHVNNVRAPLS